MLTRWDYTVRGGVTPGFYIDNRRHVLVRRGKPSSQVGNANYTPATEAELLSLRLDGLIQPRVVRA